MKPHKAPPKPPVESLQSCFVVQFKALDGFDRMTRRWESLTTLPDLYGPSPATKSALASVDFGQQKIAKALVRPLSESTVQRVLAPVAQVTAQQSSSQAAMRWATVSQAEPVLAQTRAMQAVVQSLRNGPVQQLVQQTQSHQRIIDLQVASMRPLVADRLFATPSDFGFAALSRQLSGWATPDLSSFLRLADYGSQHWLNDIARQQTLFRDLSMEAAKSATLSHQGHLSAAASMRTLFETLTESITPFSGLNHAWANPVLEWAAQQAAVTRTHWVDLLHEYPWEPDTDQVDDWVLPGTPGTLEYPLLTAADFRIITNEAVAATPYAAWFAVCVLIQHLGPVMQWAQARLDQYNLYLFLLPIAAWLRGKTHAAQKRASEDD